MSIKNRLLAAGMAVTALVGGQSEARPAEDSVSDKVVVSLNSNLSKAVLNALGTQASKDSTYAAHCQKIYDNIEGSNFTFGDTRLMRNAFLNIAKNPLNKKLVSSIPADYKIESAFFIGEDSSTTGAVNFNDQSRMQINTAMFSSSEDDLKIRQNLYGSKGDGVSFKLYRMMKHEMIHEWDKTAGRFLEITGSSAMQCYSADLKTEAHACAWDEVGSLMYKFIDGYNDIGSCHALEKFKTQDVWQQIEAVQKKQGFVFSNEMKQMVKNMQTQLRQGKSLESAQKELVGQFVEDFFNPEDVIFRSEFKEIYYYQATRKVLDAYKKGKITLKGDAKAEKGLNDFFYKEYKVNPAKFKSSSSVSELSQLLKRAENVLKKHPDVSSQEYQSGIDHIMKDFSAHQSSYYNKLDKSMASLSDTLRQKSSPSIDFTPSGKTFNIDFGKHGRSGMV